MGHPLALAAVQSSLPSLVTTAPEIGRQDDNQSN